LSAISEKVHQDQMGRKVIFSAPPLRIVSIVPSQTELLIDLGLIENLVGITKFCIHPKQILKKKKIVGGTKKLNFDSIASLKPDLIIGNKEENEKEQVEALSKLYPVWMSDIYTLEDAYDMISKIGRFTETSLKADSIIDHIKSAFNAMETALSSQSISPKSVAYFIWRKPYMVAGSQTIIGDLLKKCGLRNVFEPESRYPMISIEDLKIKHPDLIFLSSEPYPFQEKHVNELRSFFPASKILLVDGEMFSWYGSRLQYAPNYFAKLLQSIA
jgi:ABC-type Fe3+-hydroxamate transport system substrate-binding protein